jgi:S-adenosylhomocysteine hydrolase
LREVRVDWLILGTSEVRPDGRVGDGVAKVCDPTGLSVVLTESDADQATRAHLAEAGVQVVLA